MPSVCVCVCVRASSNVCPLISPCCGEGHPLSARVRACVRVCARVCRPGKRERKEGDKSMKRKDVKKDLRLSFAPQKKLNGQTDFVRIFELLFFHRLNNKNFEPYQVLACELRAFFSFPGFKKIYLRSRFRFCRPRVE